MQADREERRQATQEGIEVDINNQMQTQAKRNSKTGPGRAAKRLRHSTMSGLYHISNNALSNPLYPNHIPAQSVPQLPQHVPLVVSLVDRAPEAGGGPTPFNSTTPAARRIHKPTQEHPRGRGRTQWRQLLCNLEGGPGLRQQPKLMVAAVWTSRHF